MNVLVISSAPLRSAPRVIYTGFIEILQSPGIRPGSWKVMEMQISGVTNPAQCSRVSEADVDKMPVQYQEYACEMLGSSPRSTFTDFDPFECMLESLMYATVAGKKPYCFSHRMSLHCTAQCGLRGCKN